MIPRHQLPEAVWQALDRLFQQIDGAGFRDSHGHPIENMAALQDLKALLRD